MGFLSRLNQPITERDTNFHCLSLFSGILGIDLGFERSGFCSRLAVDIDPHAARATRESRLRSFPRLEFLTRDIRHLRAEEFIERVPDLADRDRLVLLGGPPCQPFSKSGQRAGLNSESGGLFREYIRLLKALRPAAFLLENVRGLYSSGGGEDFRQVLREFREAEYFVYWQILDAANFGVPQFRQRLFIVGFREPLAFQWPLDGFAEPPGDTSGLLPGFSLKPYVTASEALSKMPESAATAPPITGRYAHLIQDIPPGLNYSFYTDERGHPSALFSWRSKFWYFLHKADPTKPSLTIQAFPGSNTGPFHWDSRRFSLRELLRLQSFPDWWDIQSSYWIGHRLIGNAVPPLLAGELARSIKTALQAKKTISAAHYQEDLWRSLARPQRVRSGRGSSIP